jgi:carbonic anhydrase
MPPLPQLSRSLRWSAALALAIVAMPAAAVDLLRHSAPVREGGVAPQAQAMHGDDDAAEHGASMQRPARRPPLRSSARPSSGEPLAASDEPLAAIGERIDERIRMRTNASSHATVAPVASRSSAGQGAGSAVEPSSSVRPVHAAARRSNHWSYEGADGPQAWARLRPEFARCSKGVRQSPIDIQDGIKVQLEPIAFDYKPGPFRVVDNGHTVQVNVAPGSSIEVMGRRYELVQFHFHRPSEERVDGKQFDMVVHLVHKDPEGRLAVVAVLLERGSAQPVVQSVWNNLPLEKNDEVAVRTVLDPSGLLPADRGYYTYMGSLTTPPCSEGVLWMVMKNPQPVSPDQIDIFARLYPMNARPIQASSGRLIKESD